MNAFDFFSGPTGGLSYHLSAFRHRRTLWTSFRQTVDLWLAKEWNPNAAELIIFGTSAGWTLPLNFLCRFDLVIGIEPDPLARLLFQHRLKKLGGPPLVMIGDATLLPWFSERGALDSFLKKRPHAAILFANVLGQIHLLTKRSVMAQQEFLEALANRSWATYHDIISSRSRSRPDFPRLLGTGEVSLEDLAERCFGGPSRVTDHETLWLGRERETHLTDWQIRPGQNHIIGFVHS